MAAQTGNAMDERENTGGDESSLKSRFDQNGLNIANLVLLHISLDLATGSPHSRNYSDEILDEAVRSGYIEKAPDKPGSHGSNVGGGYQVSPMGYDALRLVVNLYLPDED